jgi:hypothetical protein
VGGQFGPGGDAAIDLGGIEFGSPLRVRVPDVPVEKVSTAKRSASGKGTKYCTMSTCPDRPVAPAASTRIRRRTRAAGPAPRVRRDALAPSPRNSFTSSSAMAAAAAGPEAGSGTASLTDTMSEADTALPSSVSENNEANTARCPLACAAAAMRCSSS